MWAAAWPQATDKGTTSLTSLSPEQPPNKGPEHCRDSTLSMGLQVPAWLCQAPSTGRDQWCHRYVSAAMRPAPSLALPGLAAALCRAHPLVNPEPRFLPSSSGVKSPRWGFVSRHCRSAAVLISLKEQCPGQQHKGH